MHTSSTHGFKFLSTNISKPSNSKQTLSLDGDAPGRHIRYAANKCG